MTPNILITWNILITRNTYFCSYEKYNSLIFSDILAAVFVGANTSGDAGGV